MVGAGRLYDESFTGDGMKLVIYLSRDLDTEQKKESIRAKAQQRISW